MERLTYAEIEKRAIKGTSFDGTGKVEDLIRRYGAIHTLLEMDVTEYIVRPSDVNQYLIFFGTGEKCIAHISESVEIENAILTYYYSNPQSYNRRGEFGGRVNHYIVGEIALTLSNGEVKTTGVFGGCFTSKEMGVQAVADQLKKVTGVDPMVASKRSNLEVFMMIHNLSKDTRYKNTNANSVKKSIANLLDVTIEASIEALVKAEFVTRNAKTYTKDGQKSTFETLAVTEKGLKRLESVM